MPKLEPPLMRKKRRALHEKHRERRHPDVAHSIGRIDSATLVRKAIQASSQRTEEGFKGPRIPFLLVESTAAPRPPYPAATVAITIHSH
jgi:hypothetical protein